MRRLVLSLLAAAMPVYGQEADHSAHGGHLDHSQPALPPPTDHAADSVHDPAAMEEAREALYEESGGMRTGALELALAELRLADEATWRLEGQGWFGGDVHRLLLRFDVATEGGSLDETRIEALYSRAVAPYWNLVAGVRGDSRPEPARGFVALGIEGLAPYGFESGITAYLSDEGELEARLAVHSNLRLTGNLLLEPRMALDLSFSDVPERQLGTGVSNLELGLRLLWDRYRRFSPYAGVEWQGSFGGTARQVEDAGEDPRTWRVLLGFRAWF